MFMLDMVLPSLILTVARLGVATDDGEHRAAHEASVLLATGASTKFKLSLVRTLNEEAKKVQKVLPWA